MMQIFMGEQLSEEDMEVVMSMADANQEDKVSLSGWRGVLSPQYAEQQYIQPFQWNHSQKSFIGT